ncbi:carbohydrate kinase family protein [Rhizobium sp. TRM95111]|uniref:carbohydrate kinase family protein n=1 Tax=Rhizobium alarense TaxID=2846851 RepID=UPI001F3341F1|nr:carbohydrate kinase family protein [Rhizobium alarense]MCF3642419.1 carbohydrate kinase family protein [Rhizobium alarense]
MSGKRILALGGAHVDRRGRITGETRPGASNPGSWFVEAGGGTFNCARNLARLGHAVRLVSPRGADEAAALVERAAVDAGVEDTPFVFLDRATPSYTAILEANGDLVIALADMDLYRFFTPRRLRQRAVREAIAAADLLLTDANLPEETVAAIAAAAAAAGVPAVAIGISPAKVVRLRPALAGLDHVFMNEAEARTLAGHAAERPEDWPELLRAAGLSGGVVTRGARAAVAFDAGGTALVEPPALATVADVTGAGDALAAGFLAARLAGVPLGEALRRGVAAAALTVVSPHAVCDSMDAGEIDRLLPLVPQARLLP